MSFTGTLDKCKACDKTVYFVDLLTADGVTYHKACFRCSHCKGTLSVCSIYFLLQMFLLLFFFFSYFQRVL
ncbi:putative transcription factor interactor and regulator LIM family [Helianthus annuus]|nr:putative transcription factor interactor and regulator LIM family [Helianthus annuus]